MDPVSNSRVKIDQLLEFIPEEDREGGGVIDHLGEKSIQELCKRLLGQEAPHVLKTSEHELTEKIWREVAQRGNQNLVIQLKEGGKVVYEPRVLQQFLENSPSIKDLTDMYTLKFEKNKKSGKVQEMRVSKATLRLCGDYLKGMVQSELKEAQAKTIDFTKAFKEFYDAFNDLLNEVKTGKREMEDDVYQVIREKLLYSKWYPPISEVAFGKEQWEKYFPVKIEEAPPFPDNINEILELEDPYESGKTLRETCMLFLRPEKVILHDEEGNKVLILTFNGLEELMQKATNPERRAHYKTFWDFRVRMNQMPVAKAGWVLMRKEVLPGSRNQSFEEQKKLLKGNFEVPKIVDAILLNILTYAREGEYLFGRGDPRTFTRCQEKYGNYQAIVGGFAGSVLQVTYNNFDNVRYALSASWKF